MLYEINTGTPETDAKAVLMIIASLGGKDVIRSAAINLTGKNPYRSTLKLIGASLDDDDLIIRVKNLEGGYPSPKTRALIEILRGAGFNNPKMFEEFFSLKRDIILTKY